MAKERNIGFVDLHVQLKISNMLLVAQLKERLQQQELISILMTTGASDQDIAEILGTTAATVSATKGRLRKKSKAKAKSVNVEMSETED